MLITNKRLISFIILLFSFSSIKACNDDQIWFKGPQLQDSSSAWLNQIKQERITGKWKDLTISDYNLEKQIWLKYPSLHWTLTSYIHCQVHLWDQFLWDTIKQEYTPDILLNDLKQRYGGIDSILLWPIYPNIGLDEQNIYDRISSLPGGRQKLTQLVKDFHDRDIKVLLGYLPWEKYTRNGGLENTSKTDVENLHKLLNECGFDGFNGDTMNNVPIDFFYNKSNPDKPFAIEPEDGAQGNSFWWTPMGWGYFTNGDCQSPKIQEFDIVPAISLQKWLSYRGMHMVHITERWAHDRISPIQIAHFNGVGYNSWENVWGIWNGFTPRAGELLKRVQRGWYYLGQNQYTQNFTEWIPHTEQVGSREELIFASKFVQRSEDKNFVFMIVNRGDKNTTTLVKLLENESKLYNFYNFITGEQITPNDDNTIIMDIESYGVNTLLAVKTMTTQLSDLLHTMYTDYNGKSLQFYSNVWQHVNQIMTSNTKTSISKNYTNMKFIPKTEYLFKTNGTEQEPFYETDWTTKDVQFPWENQPRDHHQQSIKLDDFFIDVNLVTRKDYQIYLINSKYKPQDSKNFLKGWQITNKGEYISPEEDLDLPVTSITVFEVFSAAKFCEFYGKRLPKSWEWQYAAQGNDDRKWPWGNQQDGPKYFSRVPTPCSRQQGKCQMKTVFKPTKIGQFSPQGDSYFGIKDMVGNVWQFMADQFYDAHTKRVMLKGGSSYDLQNLERWEDQQNWEKNGLGLWYFSTSYNIQYNVNQISAEVFKVNQHNMWMMMSDSFDRHSTVGFRCVCDKEEGKNEFDFIKEK